KRLLELAVILEPVEDSTRFPDFGGRASGLAVVILIAVVLTDADLVGEGVGVLLPTGVLPIGAPPVEARGSRLALASEGVVVVDELSEEHGFLVLQARTGDIQVLPDVLTKPALLFSIHLPASRSTAGSEASERSQRRHHHRVVGV